ncbi:MDR/zinc-dependent alcohol dehydrogenase-like family protein [Candidatus Fokinia crypta]|uniref:Quinone oxidoreductase 1 n=1 Tax=Candidatus Fokinia crypta TaxID=1920990 RepID=A0ABZ0UPN8_9RICK|nr:hypothetical protein [Candidatus Fokinia cryptica]WPX98076.1 Quinone oxidoreductase 1 [Candidatus Fokinia cryptica]
MGYRFEAFYGGGVHSLRKVDDDTENAYAGRGVLIENIAVSIEGIDISDIVTSKSQDGFCIGYVGCGRIVNLDIESKSKFSVGDVVLYIRKSGKTLSKYVIVNASNIVILPNWLKLNTTVSMFFKLVQAYILLAKVYVVFDGTIVLIHNATSAESIVLGMVAQYAKAKKVIGVLRKGTNISPEVRVGYNDFITLNDDNEFLGQIKSLTDYSGVHVTYDNTGVPSIQYSVSSLLNFGTIINYGSLIQPIESIDVKLLQKKSLFFTKCSALQYQFISQPNFILNILYSFDLLAKEVALLPVESISSEEIVSKFSSIVKAFTEDGSSNSFVVTF